LFDTILAKQVLVIEYIKGEKFQEFSEMPEENKRKCLQCVQELHLKNIAHGDLRAPNFILTSDRIFLFDYGESTLEADKETIENEIKEFKFQLDLNI